MFKKNKKQTETIKEPKEKKVRTVKVGTHKKTVIALWVVLIASVSFGVYKNFTAIDQHTTHEFMLSLINWVFVIFYRNFLMKFLADKNSVVLVQEP